MSAAIRNVDGTAVCFEPVRPTHTNPAPRVLMTLEGRVPGDVLNCVLIDSDVGTENRFIMMARLAFKTAREL